MTSQTRKFIELPDIIGLRLDCKTEGCGTSLSVAVDRETGAFTNILAANNRILAQCPNCGSQWMTLGPSAVFDSEVKQFIRMMNELKKSIPRFGCGVMLEIREEAH